MGIELLKETAIEMTGERIINGTTQGSDVFDIGVSASSILIPGWKGKALALGLSAAIDYSPFAPGTQLQTAFGDKSIESTAVDIFTGGLNAGLGSKASGSIGRQFGKKAEAVTENAVTSYEALLNKVLQGGVVNNINHEQK